MNYHEKIKRYSRLYKKGFNRFVRIEYRRSKVPVRYKNGEKKYIISKPFFHTYHGKIIEIKKASLKILVNDEQLITIGFRTIKESVYLDQSSKIKANLYFGIGKHKPRLLKT